MVCHLKRLLNIVNKEILPRLISKAILQSDIVYLQTLMSCASVCGLGHTVKVAKKLTSYLFAKLPQAGL